MITLDQAVVYDVECFPNAFTLSMEMLHSDVCSTWEISAYRDDRPQLRQWFNHLQATQTPMIGFNNVGYDYLICHFIFNNPQASYAEIYAKNQEIFASQDRFGFAIWERDRFAPQIDLFMVHHFNNKAKTTSLKSLQVNMRSPTVVDSPIPFGSILTREQIERDIIPYNKHDVKETKRFAHYSLPAIEFRLGLMGTLGHHELEPLNYNDTKIGEKMLEQRLGDDVCFDRSSGRKQKRQSPRYRIALNEIIFPYIKFENPEFQRVLDYMRTQVLTPDDLDDPDAEIKTKGVFTNLVARVGGLDFYFGTGGVHASVAAQRFVASEEWLIRDIDVASLYPSISIVNRLSPEHLGDAFIAEYAKIPIERKTHKKGTYQNAALKLAANGAWGKSNNKYSVFFDPRYAMTIPVNGQLLLCMLVERLVQLPTLNLIQCNTDGVTYRIHHTIEPLAEKICREWEEFTLLTLESADYAKMMIKDVNNYIAISLDGKVKLKGAYEHPDPLRYAESISLMSPPGWHKNWSNIVSVRAANAAMIYGLDPEIFIRLHADPFDFMCKAKVDRQSQLLLGGVPIQSTTRYYVARNGAPMVKVSPPPKGARIGDYKRANKIPDALYAAVLAEIPPGTWDERIHTKNRSTYQDGRSAIQAGWLIAECNDASGFDFANVDYNFYINEARKLIIA